MEWITVVSKVIVNNINNLAIRKTTIQVKIIITNLLTIRKNHPHTTKETLEHKIQEILKVQFSSRQNILIMIINMTIMTRTNLQRRQIQNLLVLMRLGHLRVIICKNMNLLDRIIMKCHIILNNKEVLKKLIDKTG